MLTATDVRPHSSRCECDACEAFEWGQRIHPGLLVQVRGRKATVFTVSESREMATVKLLGGGKEKVRVTELLIGALS